MSEEPKRPILVLLTSHWVSMLGVALVTTAGFSWLFVLPIQLRGHSNNPYTIEEASPGVLKTLGLEDRITSLQRH